MKKQYAPIERKILRWSKQWQKRLGIEHVEIEHVFLDSYFGDDGEEDFKVTAVTEGRWNYYEAKVKWYLPSAIRHDDVKLEETLVHELCHVLLMAEQSIIETLRSEDMDKVADILMEKVEASTELTARAIWKAYFVPAEQES